MNMRTERLILLEKFLTSHLTELKKADAGYRFEDENGEYSYRGKGEQLLSLHELLE